MDYEPGVVCSPNEGQHSLSPHTKKVELWGSSSTGRLEGGVTGGFWQLEGEAKVGLVATPKEFPCSSSSVSMEQTTLRTNKAITFQQGQKGGLWVHLKGVFEASSRLLDQS